MRTPEDDELRQLRGALHRLYIESLPNVLHRRQLNDRQDVNDKDEAVILVNDLLEALRIVAAAPDERLDRLQKWHLVAAMLNRRPDLAAQPEVLAGLVQVVRSGYSEGVDPVDEVEMAQRLSAFADRTSVGPTS